MASHRLTALLATAALAAIGAAPAHAGPAHDQVDRIVARTLDSIAAAKTASGAFTDPVKGSVGGAGLPQLGFPALKASQITGGNSSWDAIAAATFARGVGGTKLITMWPAAVTWSTGAGARLPEAQRRRLAQALSSAGKLHASGIADVCFQRRASGCFNNYVVMSELMNLELWATGLKPSGPSSRLSDRAIVSHSLSRLMSRTAAHASSGYVVGRDGQALPTELISDPSTYPLAYQALTTAMVVRGADIAARVRPLSWQTRARITRLLRSLLITVAPTGEVAWMGRGQDTAWSLAAVLYAASAGQRLTGDTTLRRQLSQLAAIELTALETRSKGDRFLQVRPDNATPAGFDHYASAIGNASLAMTFLQLARPDLGNLAPAGGGTPATTPGTHAYDPGSHVLTARSKWGWMGIHTVASHETDPRYDFGLLRALAQNEDGSWVQLMPARPITDGKAALTSAPTIQGVRPVVTRVDASGDTAYVIARWRGQSARFTWKVENGRAIMQGTCPAGQSVAMTAWLPIVGELGTTDRTLTRAGYSIAADRPITYNRYRSGASSREAALGAYSLRYRCGARKSVFRFAFSGTEPARG